MQFAKIKQKVFLQSIGCNPDFYLSSSSSSESDCSEDEEVKNIPSEQDNATPLDIPQRDLADSSSDPEEDNVNLPMENDQQERQSPTTEDRSELPSVGSSRGEKDLPQLDRNPGHSS